jgi:hypothetical protein
VIVQVDAGRAAVILNLIPVFGIASAVIFLGEGLTGRDALGAVLIGSSVAYFTIADHREATAQSLRAEQTAPLIRAGQDVALPRMATAGSGQSAPPASDDG